MFTFHPTLKFVSALMLGAFFVVAGLSVSMGMTMSMDGTMTPCPFMNDDGAVCPMSLAEHVADWQQFSTALPTAVSIATLIFVVFSFTMTVVFRPSHYPQLLRHLRKRNREVKAFSSLFTALARGIMHSRRFA